MQQLWNRLETFLQENHPEIFKDLAPPATDAEITDLEDKIGVKLPDDFVACLKIHNGQFGRADGLFDESKFLSTSRIFQEWSVLKGILDTEDFFDSDEEAGSSDGVKIIWWSARWIPFISYGNGDNWSIDLDPAEDGTVGQVITFWHETFEREKEANSFKEWFSNFIDQQIDG